MGKKTQAQTALMENEHVKELLSILEANRVDSKDLRDLLGYVGAMERQLDTAVGELQSMRLELNQMREEQSHPAKAALRNAARSLEGTVTETRERLDSLKESFVAGCKNAVAAFREKGISALNHIAGFLGIKDGLENLRDSLTGSIQASEKAIAKIEAASAEFHQAGSHVRNMGRMIRGKEAVREVKPSGKLAKLLEAPFRSELSHLKGAKKNLEGAIGKLERLEQTAVRTPIGEKPSVLENMQAFKEQSAQTKRKNPATEKQKRAEPGL